MREKKVISRVGVKMISVSDFGGRLKFEVYRCPFCGKPCTWLHRKLIKPYCHHADQRPGTFKLSI
jgi:hypothetical protein